MQCTTLEDVEIFLFPGKRRRRGGPLGIYSSQARAPHPFSIDILLHILTDFERDTSICSRASIAHVAPGKAAATLTRTELEISSSSSPFWVVSLSLSLLRSLSLSFLFLVLELKSDEIPGRRRHRRRRERGKQ